MKETRSSNKSAQKKKTNSNERSTNWKEIISYDNKCNTNLRNVLVTCFYKIRLLEKFVIFVSCSWNL